MSDKPIYLIIIRTTDKELANWMKKAIESVTDEPVEIKVIE